MTRAAVRGRSGAWLPDRGTPADSVGHMDAHWVASGLRARVLVPLAVAFVVLLGSFMGLIAMTREKAAQRVMADTALAVDALLNDQIAHEVATMRTAADLLLRDPRLEAAFRARDRDALLGLAAPMMRTFAERNAISHFYFILPDRTTLLRVHAPEEHGDRIDRAVLREAERTGRPAWANEQGPLGTFTLRVVHPWHVQGRLIGYLELGVQFEHVAAGLKKVLGADVLVTIDKARLDRARWASAAKASRNPVDWDEFPSSVLLVRTIQELPPKVRQYLAAPGARHDGSSFAVAWGERAGRVIATPFSVDGHRVGELLVIEDTTIEEREQHEAMARAAALGGGIGGSLMLFFYVLLGRVQCDVTSRTARLNETMRVLHVEQDERQRAERELALQQERNELLEARSRMVDELAAAKGAAEAALQENEETTRKLRNAQNDLVAAAREAGRAEIASNVLHNVGNVLNSVNVSAGLIGTALRRSRLPGLVRGLGLMKDHPALGDYLTGDPTGRKLPAYLCAVADTLAAEQKHILEEVSSLTKSVDHIKDIVATQQTHAKAGDIIEPVDPAELAEDALRMQRTALTRHHVTVVRAFSPVPVVPLDRGRVLQILVNLISNAKQAIVATGTRTGRLTLAVELAPGQRLRFSVQDEGEGIAPENLTRIFAHGFTTRSAGHGFGLHSSALAARAMGGTLTASSDGVGRGATFVLEIPLGDDRGS